MFLFPDTPMSLFPPPPLLPYIFSSFYNLFKPEQVYLAFPSPICNILLPWATSQIAQLP